jgi:hypothetical protein
MDTAFSFSVEGFGTLCHDTPSQCTIPSPTAQASVFDTTATDARSTLHGAASGAVQQNHELFKAACAVCAEGPNALAINARAIPIIAVS